jgi:hypothetical protein
VAGLKGERLEEFVQGHGSEGTQILSSRQSQVYESEVPYLRACSAL